jgi:hypothetical protein
MTLASTLKQFVEQLAISARIVSPRFTDYRIESFDYYTEPASFDDIIREEVKKILGEEQAQQENSITSTISDSGLGISNVMSFAGAGRGGIMGIVRMLAPMLGPAVAALMAPVIFNMVLDELTRVGGPLDTRFKRDIANEVENYFSRQIQRDTQIGNRQVIIQAQARFLNKNGAGNSNTFRQIRESGDRLSELGLHVEDRAKGLERLR